METSQKSSSRVRPAVITILAFLLGAQGISEIGTGIWMIITGRMLFPSKAIRLSAIDYLIQLFSSHSAQIIFFILIGMLFFVLVWGLITLKPWSYWVTFIVVLPLWMIYDLIKTILLFFHTLPPTMFEDPDISSSTGSFIIELVLLFFLLRKNTRNAFYPPQVKYEER